MGLEIVLNRRGGVPIRDCRALSRSARSELIEALIA